MRRLWWCLAPHRCRLCCCLAEAVEAEGRRGGTREGGRQQPTPVSLLRCLCSPVEQHPISKSSLLDSFCSNCSESELWLSKSVPVSSVVSPPGLEVFTGGSSTSCHLKPQPPTYLLKSVITKKQICWHPLLWNLELQEQSWSRHWLNNEKGESLQTLRMSC